MTLSHEFVTKRSDMFLISRTMGLLKVVLTGITDVEDVRDPKCFNDMGISSVMPVSQVQPPWENLVWIAICF